MDPLSITASVAGILSLSNEIVKYLYKFTSSVSNAQKEALELRETIDLLSSVLQSCKDSSSAGQAELFPAGSVGDRITERCSEDLNGLLGKLTKIEGTSRLKKLSWPFHKKDYQEIVCRIREYVSIFGFSASADGRYVSSI